MFEINVMEQQQPCTQVQKRVRKRFSYKFFLRASPIDSHVCTSAHDLSNLHARPPKRISTRASHQDLYQVMLGHPGRNHRDLVKSFSNGPAKAFDKHFTICTRSSCNELQRTLSKIFVPGSLRKSHKIVRKGPATDGPVLQDLDTRTFNEPPT